MIFKFRMLSDEDDNFLRDYEISYDATLKDLHTLICNDISYDEYEMCSFFLCDEKWMKLQEYTLMDMGVEQCDLAGENEQPIPMEKVLLGEVALKKFTRLLFVFDLLEDRAFFLELLEAKEAEKGMTYPRMAFANGSAPDQFDAEAISTNRSIFDQAMDDYDGFDGDDEYSDDDQW